MQIGIFSNMCIYKNTIKCNLVHGVFVFTHVALLRYRVLVLEGMVGKLRGVVGRRVAVVCGSIKRNCAVT